MCLGSNCHVSKPKKATSCIELPRFENNTKKKYVLDTILVFIKKFLDRTIICSKKDTSWIELPCFETKKWKDVLDGAAMFRKTKKRRLGSDRYVSRAIRPILDRTAILKKQKLRTLDRSPTCLKKYMTLLWSNSHISQNAHDTSWVELSLHSQFSKKNKSHLG